MIKESFVFVNNEKYYLIYFDESDVYINSYKFENRLVEIEVDESLSDYFSFYRDLSLREKRKYIYNLSNSLEFNIPKNRFFDYFVKDLDPNFLYQDSYAKHFTLDFEAIKQKKEKFFKHPKIFPFYISYLDVMIDKDYKIYKNNKQILQNKVFELDKKFRQNLIPLIHQKEKLFLAITDKLKKDYFNQKKFLESQKISDYNLDIEISIFDIAGNILFQIFCGESLFDNDKYSLKLYGINLNISKLFWRIIDNFGIKIVTTKLNIWCEVKSDLQMFYKI